MLSSAVGIDSENGVDVAVISQRFIESLDRSPLGRFAASDRAIYLADVIERSKLVQNSGVNLIDIKESAYDAVEELNDIVDAGNIELSSIYDELFFWWAQFGDIMSSYFVEDMTNDELIKDDFHEGSLTQGMKTLGIIQSHPDKHEYFAVGIWDISLIERFIADGVDSELALDIIAV